MANIEPSSSTHSSKPHLASEETTAVRSENAERANETASPKAASANEPNAVFHYTNTQWLLIVLAVYSSALFYGLDTTIVAVIQGPVVSRFKNVDKLGWLGIGFPLGSIATIAAWSKAYG